MANVTETSTWESGIYQLETTDPVEGGALGISNTQAKQLGNRTKWLYDQIIALFKFAPKNRGYFTGLNISSVAGPLSVQGDITAAVIETPVETGTSSILCTMANEMPNTNYKVRVDIQSLGTLVDDTDVYSYVFRPISTTQFRIGTSKINTETTNLRFHLEVISLD